MKTKKEQKPTAKQTGEATMRGSNVNEPLLTKEECAELQRLPAGAFEVWNANLHLVSEYGEYGEQDIFLLCYWMVTSELWLKVFDDEGRTRMWLFLESIKNVYDLSKKHQAVLDSIDDETMDVFYLVP